MASTASKGPEVKPARLSTCGKEILPALGPTQTVA